MGMYLFLMATRQQGNKFKKKLWVIVKKFEALHYFLHFFLIKGKNIDEHT